MLRWAIYIDIEGSAKICGSDEAQFFASVDVLMDGIVRIGSRVWPQTPNRLFVHSMSTATDNSWMAATAGFWSSWITALTRPTSAPYR